MRALFGGKATDELNKSVSPQQQNKILFVMMIIMVLAGFFYIISFYL